MNNLKISTRLSGAFALLVLMLVGLAVAAMTQLSAMRAATAEISDNWLPSVAAINALEATSADLRLTILAHVLSTDDAAKATIDKQIVDQRAKLAEMRKGYEKLIVVLQKKSSMTTLQPLGTTTSRSITGLWLFPAVTTALGLQP